jgi:hypothetical protein
MALESRQNRLSKLYSMQNSLCFQVFCEYSGKGLSSDRFDELVKQHNLSFEDDLGLQSLPRPKIGEIKFGDGNYIYCLDSKKGGHETFAQPIFTSTNRNLISKVRQFYDGSNYICLSNPILDCIMSKYIPGIELQLPQLDFAGKRYSDIGDIYVEFKFGIQPYDFNLHPPYDMDVLKPITIIDGHVIPPPPLKMLCSWILFKEA